jgi:ubiquinone/menaquinone biosynthesis C-methylase UbiE
LPAKRVLDLGAGQGRFAQFLKDHADTLVLIDLSENCIAACKQRFAKETNIEYFVNDGKSLDMIEDESIDFVFSHDALVFVEEDDLRGYIAQLAKILTKDGAAFLHHSNLNQYWYYRLCSPNIIKLLQKLRFIEPDHWRAYSVSAQKVKQMCDQVGLECVVQEIIPWSTKRTFVDCYSLIVPKNSARSRKPVVYRNLEFEHVKRYLGRVTKLYNPDEERYPSIGVTYDTVRGMVKQTNANQ